jgi:hypothetical protein
MDRVSPKIGIQLSNARFSDLDYADDGALLMPNRDNAAGMLQSFDSLSAHFGLRVSWPKTKIQNLGAGPAPPPIAVGPNTVDAVDEFIYLGSKVCSVGHCTPEIARRIALAAAAMNSLGRVWRENHL